MMTMYKGKRRNHRCKFAAPFSRQRCRVRADSPQLDSDSATFTRKRIFASPARRPRPFESRSYFVGRIRVSLWILCRVVGSPAARALIGVAAPAHLIREIPVGTRSRRICRVIRLPRAGVRLTFTSLLSAQT